MPGLYPGSQALDTDRPNPLTQRLWSLGLILPNLGLVPPTTCNSNLLLSSVRYNYQQVSQVVSRNGWPWSWLQAITSQSNSCMARSILCHRHTLGTSTTPLTRALSASCLSVSNQSAYGGPETD